MAGSIFLITLAPNEPVETIIRDPYIYQLSSLFNSTGYIYFLCDITPPYYSKLSTVLMNLLSIKK